MHFDGGYVNLDHSVAKHPESARVLSPPWSASDRANVTGRFETFPLSVAGEPGEEHCLRAREGLQEFPRVVQVRTPHKLLAGRIVPVCHEAYGDVFVEGENARKGAEAL